MCPHHAIVCEVTSQSVSSALTFCTMAKYKVGFDGHWQETFDDCDAAIQWAKEVADTGRVVDVVMKRFLRPPKLTAVFPESEKKIREAARAEPNNYWGARPF